MPSVKIEEAGMSICEAAGVEYDSAAAQTVGVRSDSDRLVGLLGFTTGPGRAVVLWRTTRRALLARSDALVAEVKAVKQLEDKLDDMPASRPIAQDARRAISTCDAAAVREVLGRVEA